MSLRDKLSRTPDHDAIRAALRDKVVVITGGARGIGFETATQLSEAGARVAIGDVDSEAVGKAAADLGCEGIEVDVTKRESFDAFLTEVENRHTFEGCGDRLLTQVLSRKELRDQFFHKPPGVDGSEGVWNVHECRKWLKMYEEFSLLLLVSMETKGGGPARGTELTATTFRNGANGVDRNLMVLGSRALCLVREYSKTSAHSGYSKPIPEAIDAATAYYVIQSCAVLRSFARTLLAQTDPGNDALDELYSDLMFVSTKGLFGSHDISLKLKKYTSQYLNCTTGFGIQGLRQVMIAIKHQYGGIRLDPELEAEGLVDVDEAADIAQAGHSRRIDHRHYGISTSAYMGTMPQVLNRFIDASVRWQHILKIVPGTYFLATVYSVFCHSTDLLFLRRSASPAGEGPLLRIPAPGKAG